MAKTTESEAVEGRVLVRIPLPEGVTREEAAAMSKPPHVPVCINGYTYQIRKGEDVMVPRVVADVLRNANYI